MENQYGHLILGQPSDRPVISVELDPTWYCLQIIHPDGQVEQVPFPTVDGQTPSYVGHVPNPRAVEAWAEEQGYDIDILSYELMIGRWTIEVKEEYPLKR